MDRRMAIGGGLLAAMGLSIGLISGCPISKNYSKQPLNSIEKPPITNTQEFREALSREDARIHYFTAPGFLDYLKTHKELNEFVKEYQLLPSDRTRIVELGEKVYKGLSDAKMPNLLFPELISQESSSAIGMPTGHSGEPGYRIGNNIMYDGKWLAWAALGTSISKEQADKAGINFNGLDPNQKDPNRGIVLTLTETVDFDKPGEAKYSPEIINIYSPSK